MEGFQIDSDFDGFSDFDLEIEDVFETRYITVSYTHLTLPTKRIV